MLREPLLLGSDLSFPWRYRRSGAGLFATVEWREMDHLLSQLLSERSRFLTVERSLLLSLNCLAWGGTVTVTRIYIRVTVTVPQGDHGIEKEDRGCGGRLQRREWPWDSGFFGSRGEGGKGRVPGALGRGGAGADGKLVCGVTSPRVLSRTVIC